MLPDHERKVITILSNFSLMNKRMPNMNELRKKTGLPESEIWKALMRLSERQAIAWSGTIDSIKVDPNWRSML